MTGSPDGRVPVHRVLMDRARAQAERAREPGPRRWLQHALALAAALALVTFIMLGFDAFLTAMQKYMEAEVTDPAPPPTEPVPAYVVTQPVSPPPTADQDPRPSPAPAVAPSRATRR